MALEIVKKVDCVLRAIQARILRGEWKVGERIPIGPTVPTLTSYRIPHKEIGRQSFDALIAPERNDFNGVSERIIRGEIVVRESA